MFLSRIEQKTTYSLGSTLVWKLQERSSSSFVCADLLDVQIIIWAKATFFFEQLFPGVARTWLESKSERLFLGPKFQFLVQKSDFCHTTPILVDDPFLALGMTVNFPPWERFFDFPFRSYSCFRKKIRLTRQKVFPPPTVGVPSASKSPSALSAQALRAHALRARA